MINPSDRFVATFVGSPPMNILPCQIKSEGDSIQVVPLAADVCPPVDRPAPTALPPGWEGTTRLFDLGLRPEAIAVRDINGRAESPSSGPAVIAQVRRLEFNGPEVLATLTVDRTG